MNDIDLKIDSQIPTFAVTISNELPTFAVTVQISENASQINVGLASPGPKGDPGNTIVCRAASPIGGQRVVSLNSDNEAEYPTDFVRAIGITLNAAIQGDYLTIPRRF